MYVALAQDGANPAHDDGNGHAQPRSGSSSGTAGAMRSAGPGDRSALLLEALKEELFQLETERLQGRISDAEYQQAKAALDLTIKRAIERPRA